MTLKRYIFALSCSLMLLSQSCSRTLTPNDVISDEPRLWPDYAGTTMPINIVAPSFIVDEEADYYQMQIGQQGKEPSMTISSKSGEILPDNDSWHKLLADAAGSAIYLRLTTDRKGAIEQWADVTIDISPDSIDPWIAYRLIYPGYELWNRMGIYQRSLSTYEQLPIVENKDLNRQCVNCHTFNNGDPSLMMLHVRGANGGTMLLRDGDVTKVKPKCPELPNGSVYPAWHPDGQLIAFASNNIKQYFHTVGDKPIEVSDLDSDLMIYDVANDRSVTSATVSGPEWMETFPTFTPDGKTIYFCRAKGVEKGVPLNSIRYDLCRVSFDADSLIFGVPEVVFDASTQGHSVSFPRVSPDGRYLLFTLSDYGNFSIWHPESDLWMMDLSDSRIYPLEAANSPEVDSFHTWSSSGRWIVFSSKRMDGRWARPHFAHFDPTTGEMSKAFVLPQRDPSFYDSYLRSYNVPVFINGQVAQPNTLTDFLPDDN